MINFDKIVAEMIGLVRQVKSNRYILHVMEGISYPYRYPFSVSVTDPHGVAQQNSPHNNTDLSDH